MKTKTYTLIVGAALSLTIGGIAYSVAQQPQAYDAATPSLTYDPRTVAFQLQTLTALADLRTEQLKATQADAQAALKKAADDMEALDHKWRAAYNELYDKKQAAAIK